MIRQFRKPDERIIFDDADLPAVLALKQARLAVSRAAVSGTVVGGGEDLIENHVEFSEATVSRSSLEYVDLSGPDHTYRAWHTGKIAPQGDAIPIRQNGAVGEYLLNNRWPYTDGLGVSVGPLRSESISAVDVPHKTATPSGAVTFDLSAGAVRSFDTLRLVGAAKGSATVSADLVGDKVGVWASGSSSVSGSGWSAFGMTLSGSGRLGYDNEPITLDVDPGGASEWARPRLYRKAGGLEGAIMPLPDGTALVFIEDGRGRDGEGNPITISSPASFRADMGAGQLYVYGTHFPTGTKNRAVYAGRDRSETHRIERSFQPRIWTRPTAPSEPHLPLFRSV